MEYTPASETREVLDRAWEYIDSVPYAVTARWVFYRLLQDGIFSEKRDYKRLLGYLSRARKSFYGQWKPDSLTDDTREAVVRGSGHKDVESWVRSLADTTVCYLDMWQDQENYVELWFEAAAMAAQFEHYAHPNISLLAFHGDISIPEKWEAAKRIAARWANHRNKIKILYYGDLDDKGLQIPESARKDVTYFASIILEDHGHDSTRFLRAFEFVRVGINEGQEDQYNIPENPDRPGTYQWEGLDDAAAAELIATANDYLDMAGFEEVEGQEAEATARFRAYLEKFPMNGSS